MATEQHRNSLSNNSVQEMFRKCLELLYVVSYIVSSSYPQAHYQEPRILTDHSRTKRHWSLDLKDYSIHKPRTTRSLLLKTKGKCHATKSRARSGEILRELQGPLRADDWQEAGYDCSRYKVPSLLIQQCLLQHNYIQRRKNKPHYRHYRLDRPSIHHNPTTKNQFNTSLRNRRSHLITRRTSICHFGATSEQPWVPSNPIPAHLALAREDVYRTSRGVPHQIQPFPCT